MKGKNHREIPMKGNMNWLIIYWINDEISIEKTIEKDQWLICVMNGVWLNDTLELSISNRWM